IVYPGWPLVCVIERHTVLAPDGHRRMRFEGIVVVRRRDIGVIKRDGSLRQCCLDIALRGVRLEVTEEVLWLIQISAAGAQFYVVWLLRITNRHKARSMPRCFRGLGDDGGYDLAMVGDRVGLEHREILVALTSRRIVDRLEARGVLVREHGKHAGQGERG